MGQWDFKKDGKNELNIEYSFININEVIRGCYLYSE